MVVGAKPKPPHMGFTSLGKGLSHHPARSPLGILGLGRYRSPALCPARQVGFPPDHQCNLRQGDHCEWQSKEGPQSPGPKGQQGPQLGCTFQFRRVPRHLTAQMSGSTARIWSRR